MRAAIDRLQHRPMAAMPGGEGRWQRIIINRNRVNALAA